MIRLPAGWLAQPVSHRHIDDVCFELDRVYDSAGRLQRDWTFWRVDDAVVSFAEASARHGASWREFAELEAPADRITGWLRRRPPEDQGSRISIRHPVPSRV